MKRLRLTKATSVLVEIVILFIISAMSLSAAEETPSGMDKGPTTLAIMNFTNRSPTGEWQWLAKGLADMLITDLSNARELQVVERERMQKLFDEMKLAGTGLIDETTAANFGKVAKVDKALFGSFLKEGNRLEIEAHLIDIATGELLRVEWVRGKAKKLFQLEKRLVQQLLERLDIPITDQERRSIMYVPTDSIPAFEHYSLSLDFFDNGQWFDALLECRLAVRKDAGFIKARARLAKLYYDMGKSEHALVEYRRLVETDRDNTFPEYIYYRMGRLLEDEFKDYRAAVVLYEKILARHPEYDIPFDYRRPVKRPDIKKQAGWSDPAQYDSLKALERLALIHEKRGETFEATQRFSQIIYFLRTHYFFWSDLSERVWAKYRPLYWQFVRENRDSSLCPPREIYRIPPEGTADIKIRPKEGEKYVNYWKDIFCIAPPDKEIAEVNFNVDADSVFINEDGSARIVQVSSFDPDVNTDYGYSELEKGDGWQKVNYKIKPGVRALIVRAYNAAKWDVTIKSRDWTKDAPKPRIRGLVYVKLNPEWEEIILDGKYPYPNSMFFSGDGLRYMSPDGEPIHMSGRMYMGQPIAILSPYSGDHILQVRWQDGRRETKKFHVEPRGIVKLFFDETDSDRSFCEFPQQGSHLNLFMGHTKQLWLLWDEAYENRLRNNPNQESDLFYATSADGKTWSKPKRFPFSSSALDMRPVLQQDRSGTYWLLWVSSRDSKDPKRLWIASSKDGKNWTFPRKIVLPVTEGDVKRAREMNFPSFAFTLDGQDTFWLIWQSRLFKSTDAREWTEAEALSSANGLELAPGWGGFGEYYLSHDYANRLLLVAKHKEKVITIWEHKLPGTALWRRSNEAKWEFLGFLDEQYIRSSSIDATNGRHIAVLVDKGNDGLLLRTYDDMSGWSRPEKIDDVPTNYASYNAVAILGEESCVIAHSDEQGIVVLALDGMSFHDGAQH